MKTVNYVPRPPVEFTSHLERSAWAILHDQPFPPPTKCQYRFLKSRQWRFDFAWPKQKIAYEIDGGQWLGKGHTGGKGFMADCEKRSMAAALGWKIISATGEQLEDAMYWLAIAFGDLPGPE